MAQKHLDILIANGVNLDLLGRRPSHHYGQSTLVDIENLVMCHAANIAKENGFNSWSLDFFQTNHEGDYLDKLSACDWAGMILNPGAWTHTSLALGDRLEALKIPLVEVHLSDIKNREVIRHHSFVTPHATAVISGQGADGYVAGLRALLEFLKIQGVKK